MGGIHEEHRILIEKIRDVEVKLKAPLYSDEELLIHLEEMESLLYTVDQLASTTVLTALKPTMAVLADKGMILHPNSDVCVAVLSCICEIMRITAPNKPYSDDAMKLVFQGIITSFERIDDLKSRSYKKLASILESLAELRSCILMLDLELGDLILEMFEHFLQRISPQHQPSIFESMEKIMTTIINESESDEIPEELVSCLLQSVKRERTVHLSVSFTLGQNVIQKCADKLKPVVRALVGNGIRKYSKVVASLCLETSDAIEQHNADDSFKNETDANKSERAVSDERSQKSVTAGEHQQQAECKEVVGSAGLNGNTECPKELCSAEMNGEAAAAKHSQHVTKRTPQAKDAEAMLDLGSVPKRLRSVTTRKAIDVNRLKIRQSINSLTQDINVENSKVGHRSGFKRKWGPERVVGKKIRVWWPLDEVFYDGTIHKYYRSSKKHKVIYDDGDVECLHLNDELWQFIEDKGESSSAPSKKELSSRKKVKRGNKPEDSGSNSKLPVENPVTEPEDFGNSKSLVENPITGPEGFGNIKSPVASPVTGPEDFGNSKLLVANSVTEPEDSGSSSMLSLPISVPEPDYFGSNPKLPLANSGLPVGWI